MQPSSISVHISNKFWIRRYHYSVSLHASEHCPNYGKNARAFFVVQAFVIHQSNYFFRPHPNQLHEEETIRQRKAQLCHPVQIQVFLRLWDLLPHLVVPHPRAPLRLLVILLQNFHLTVQAPLHHQPILLRVQPSSHPWAPLRLLVSLLLISHLMPQAPLQQIIPLRVQPRTLLICLPQVPVRLLVTFPHWNHQARHLLIPLVLGSLLLALHNNWGKIKVCKCCIVIPLVFL